MKMEMFLQIVAAAMFIGFVVATLNCVQAIKYQTKIVVLGWVHHRSETLKLILANLGLVLLAVAVYYEQYLFIPVVVSFVLFILALTRMRCGLTEDGVVVGTHFIPWDSMQNFKMIDTPDERPGTILLKIIAGDKQYYVVCSRCDKNMIKNILESNNIAQIKMLRV